MLAAGICGSDLHCRTHTAELLAATKMATGTELFDVNAPIVMGHEFCAEVVSYGPSSRATLPPGTRVASPGLLLRDPMRLIGYAGPETPGGYAEYMLLSEDLMFPVLENVSDEIAALAEPMTVALHAVTRGGLAPNVVPLVIGCGPVGLAIIAVLKMRGYGPIVAADFSPARRSLATAMGTDVVVDPRVISPYDAWREAAQTDDPVLLGPQNPMVPGAFRPQTIFECVGVPGVMAQVLAGATAGSKIVVAGVCMQGDSDSHAHGHTRSEAGDGPCSGFPHTLRGLLGSVPGTPEDTPIHKCGNRSCESKLGQPNNDHGRQLSSTYRTTPTWAGRRPTATGERLSQH
ncbi:hypothetical protein GCM10011610_68690 [Nocardia rhizosphaerihabitans]|uniref:Uncharacterized protein n=1 Tax=Nocardia rhizosphaerihabitans TaxID=1691570 RepID=A0ABQ2L227_9NOCA|nr:hypothetical protein GCM10011610_68690 [Nocardia rhizosphaerihabitans]